MKNLQRSKLIPVLVGMIFLSVILLNSIITSGVATTPTSTSPTTATAIQPSLIECPIDFLNEEIVTNPTKTSMMIAMKPAEAADIYVEYGTAGGTYGRRTAVQNVAADESVFFSLNGLQANNEYQYRVRCKKPSEASFGTRKEHSFKTLKKENTSINFAIAADSHIFQGWIKYACDNNQTYYPNQGFQNFLSTKNNILSKDFDFLLISGDNFNTHGQASSVSCPGHTEYGVGTVQSHSQAAARYEKTLSPEVWGSVATDMPFLYMLGNHEGETYFGNSLGSCQHYGNTIDFSRTARLSHLPDPTQVYSGSQNQDLYYTFTSGDARIIILDIMTGNQDYPSLDEWSLGPNQIAWFKQVLETNEKEWVFVFMEHLAGGDPNSSSCNVFGGGTYDYARGGLRATDTQLINGTFSGEQEYLNNLMVNHSVDIVFHNHDHVMAAGEAQDPNGIGEGIYYVVTGHAAGNSSASRWSDDPWFQKAYDYNYDGVGDFDQGITGTRDVGFFDITVNATQADIKYIRSDAENASIDGTVSVEFTLFSDGTSTLP